MQSFSEKQFHFFVRTVDNYNLYLAFYRSPYRENREPKRRNIQFIFSADRGTKIGLIDDAISSKYIAGISVVKHRDNYEVEDYIIRKLDVQINCDNCLGMYDCFKWRNKKFLLSLKYQ